MQTRTHTEICQSRGAHEAKAEDQGGSGRLARRKCMVEPVFGQIKRARGFRQFLLRGLHKVRGEWALICMTHNRLKFHKDGLGAFRGMRVAHGQREIGTDEQAD
jgi:Transposase DDE domain